MQTKEVTMSDTNGASTDSPTKIPTTDKPKQKRGFASMDPERRRQIAGLGGKASHAKGTGHEWDKAAAAEAGRKGGLASRGGQGKLAK